ncbi:predicted protein [Aspergillus nidulans FGSC A4]|uniref:BTB domain-containing protein n=1 Tax=Emericella nidulans (strain FGSC A4 / ATCC 38163 / CBS 112.46 / NRRL 194 / M139) TaxID=227321 RepID=Q5B2B1_EMENI|nr:hypothetical protein [Aspergillus nidulans FGSC A4]EAA62479.1 predicted protein [Aspergillus nidulans FGSC A4]CBF82107.1 TPA: conserved hypothetical protein [Aspergillus nidulans FGSC A4]|eukprot:XP_662923.1 predicted protein [Aspergillus nidulans FGSC A4]
MSTEVIDPYGDIIVACSNVNFLVSSNALSLASPVFYSMFRPGIKEGLAVRGIPGSLDVPVIPFPDDDSDTFLLFCNLAHHKLPALPETLNATLLKDLAVFIVKYACRPAIIDRGWLWITKDELSAELSPEDCWNALLFAYAMDLPDRFSYFSGKLLSSRRQSFSNWDYALANLEFIPHHVLEQLDIKQALLHFNVETALMEIVSVAQTKSSKECRKLKMFLGSYSQILWKAGILPGMLELRRKTLPQIMQCALGLPAISYNPGSGECDGYYNECYCSHANELDIKQHLLKELMKCAEDEQAGICLLCVKREPCDKHPRLHKEDGNLGNEEKEVSGPAI